jgi:hypothetical protein
MRFLRSFEYHRQVHQRNTDIGKKLSIPKYYQGNRIVQKELPAIHIQNEDKQKYKPHTETEINGGEGGEILGARRKDGGSRHTQNFRTDV